MPEIKVSIIIAISNSCEIAEACLQSLAKYQPNVDFEVLAVSDASATGSTDNCACAGKKLFGENFRLIPAPGDNGFFGCVNLGSTFAVGEYLLFVDEGIIFMRGWFDPLLDDFCDFPQIAVTCPMLLYPQSTPIGPTIRNPGLFVSPTGEFGNLYNGIPAASELAGKRRFFQAIDMHCVLLPAKLFREQGIFEIRRSNFSVGLDFCAKLCAKGWRLTVNAESKLEYRPSIIAAYRNFNEPATIDNEFHTDLIDFLQADGLTASISEWYDLLPQHNPAEMEKLDKIASSLSYGALQKLLLQFPYWKRGWSLFTQMPENQNNTQALQDTISFMFSMPWGILAACANTLTAGSREMAASCLPLAERFCHNLNWYIHRSQKLLDWAEQAALPQISQTCAVFLKNPFIFKANFIDLFIKKFWQLAIALKLPLSPANRPIYAAWNLCEELPARAGKRVERSIEKPWQKENAPGFSILLPLTAQDTTHLRSALSSILAQDWQKFELILAPAFPVDAQISGILADYSTRDTHIQIIWPEKPCDLAYVANMALERATGSFCMLLDVDTQLAADCLALFADAIMGKPDAMMVYSDMDHVDALGDFCRPYFHNGKWDIWLALGGTFSLLPAVFNTGRLKDIGGFRQGFGNAYAFEMLLRFTDAQEPEYLMHISHVAMHCRSSNNAPALDDFLRKASQSFLDQHLFCAHALPLADTGWSRISLAEPASITKLAIICDFTGSAYSSMEAFAQAWKAGPCQPEIILCSDENTPVENARILNLPQDISSAQRLNVAVRETDADIIGFVSSTVSPLTETWAKEIASCLNTPKIGICGGKVVNPDGILVNAGYLVDVSRKLVPILQNASAQIPVWHGWNMLARTVDALDEQCFFTKRKLFIANGGFDEKAGVAMFEDYCLRIANKGLISLWWPYAEFKTEAAARSPELQNMVANLGRKWKLEPFNENILVTDKGMVLAPKPELSAAFAAEILEFEPSEYFTLHKDAKTSGLDAFEHYLRQGRKAGYSATPQKLDYSQLTPQKLARFKTAPKGDIVVCTALMGNYEKLLPPAYLNDGWRYVCYTDTPLETWGIWEARQIPYKGADATRKSRWVKTHLPQLFPEARRVLYMDANIVISRDISTLVEDRPEQPLLLVKHPWRNCLFEEGAICAMTGKDKKNILMTQLAEYRKNGMPENFGLYECNVILLNPADPRVGGIFKAWWHQLEKYSRRDQISLPYVLFKTGFKPGQLFPDNISARNYEGFVYLGHAETDQVMPPGFLRQK